MIVDTTSNAFGFLLLLCLWRDDEQSEQSRGVDGVSFEFGGAGST